jgi:hypothetical protein
MDLGRLPELMDRLAGMGSGITITPVMEEGIAFSHKGPVRFVAGWDITCSCLQGTFTVSGKSIPEAVAAAFVNLDAHA